MFIVLRAQIVRTILGSGSFNWDDTRLTAACLALFVVSLVGQGLELLFIRGYYAAGRTAKPLFINLISSVATIGLPFVFMKIFEHNDSFRYFMESLFKVGDVPGSAVLMLPLGYSLGTLINGVAFWFIFQKDFGSFNKKVLPTLSQSLQAAVFGGFIAYVGLNIFAGIFNQDTATGIFFQGFLAGILGIATCIAIFKLLGNSEIEEVWRALKQKIVPDKIIVSEPDKIEA